MNDFYVELRAAVETQRFVFSVLSNVRKGGDKLTMITAYDFPTAQIVDRAPMSYLASNRTVREHQAQVRERERQTANSGWSTVEHPLRQAKTR